MANRELIYRGETRVPAHVLRSSSPGEFTELADGFVHYELGGSSGAQMVVLVPGFSVPLQIWDPTYHALIDAGYRVLRYDLFGRGFSDRPDSRYDLDFFDRQLVGLLEALDISAPIDLVGLFPGRGDIGCVCRSASRFNPEARSAGSGRIALDSVDARQAK